jgi:hypothetical protein
MATEDTVDLSAAHAPQPASLDAFSSILDSVKHELSKLRRDHDSKRPPSASPSPVPPINKSNPEHEPEYFHAVAHLSDHELSSFTASDLESVRVATTAYGLHLFGKVRLPALENGFIHIRVFGSAREGTDGSSLDEREYSLHSIHTEEVVREDGDRVYRAVFGRDDELEWFET